MPAVENRIDWGDEVDETGEETAFGTTTTIEPDGTKVVVEYRTNEDGKRVKVTRRIRMRLVKTKASQEVAERKKWTKFGEAYGLKAGPDSNSTSYGEKVFLKLSQGQKEIETQEAADEANKKSLLLSKSKISCRICKGDHWTSKCPFKDTHQPLDEMTPSESKESLPLADSGPSAEDSGKPGKYVPPSMRDRKPGEVMPGRAPRDDVSTLRITNLSEDVTEQDVKDLVGRFGHTSRVYVARDKETNTCKGFAFVSFYNRDDAEKALNALNGYGYDNLILHVEWA
ncbi:translation initiation factor eIF3 subunit g, partial [Quaeritorhiza haematococci]